MANNNQLSQLNHFQVLSKLDAETKTNIKLLCIFGKDGKEVLVITNDDQVFAYGTNTEGCLGLPINKKFSKPTFVPDLSNKGIIELSYGSFHVIARTTGDELLTWGNNEYGQLGNGSQTSSSKPYSVTELNRTKLSAITCGLLHSMVLTELGDIYAWGFNQNGQIGNMSKSGNQLTPAKLDRFSRDPIVSIAAGAAHSLALDKRGHLYSWGYNRFGQLGSGNLTAISTPAPVYDLLNFRAQKVFCGPYHSLVLSTDGSLYSFGSNEFKQLGKDIKHSNIPTEIVIKHANGTKKQIKDIATSVYCNLSAAVTQDDVYYQWGKCGNDLIPTPKETQSSSFHELFAMNAESKITYLPIYLNPELYLRRTVSIDTRSSISPGDEGFTSLYKQKVVKDKMKNDKELVKILLWSAVHKIEKKDDDSKLAIFKNVIDFVKTKRYMETTEDEEEEENDMSEDKRKETREKYDKVRVMFENCYSDYTSLKGVFTQTGRYKREFEEQSQLGKGGFGFVFKAKNKFDDNMYAVKKIGVQDEEDSKLKMRELKIWAHLNTIYVVQYKSSWIESNTSQFEYLGDSEASGSSSGTIERPFSDSAKSKPSFLEGKAILHIQMELCKGTLHDIINTEFRQLIPELRTEYDLLSPIGYYIACELYLEILECIDYLHKLDKQVIHRDLKPANILITDGANGRFVKIADFGLATLHHFDQDSHSQALGTRLYIAPEVYNGRRYNTKADIYSLGVIMKDLFNIDTLVDKTNSTSFSTSNSSSKSAGFEKSFPLVYAKYDAMSKFYNEMISHTPSKRPNCEKVLTAKDTWILTLDELKSDKSFGRLSEKINSNSRDLFDKFYADFIIQKTAKKLY